MKYYEIKPVGDDKIDAWYLAAGDSFDDGTPLDFSNIWEYVSCKQVHGIRTVPFNIKKEGFHTDINYSAFIQLVVSKRVGDILQSIAPDDIQRIPAKIKDDSGTWEVINVLHAVNCIDYKKSLLSYNPPDDPRRPNELTNYYKLIIDPSNVGSHHIFRVAEYNTTIIISGAIVDALRKTNATGLGIMQVYPDDGHIDEEVKRFLNLEHFTN